MDNSLTGRLSNQLCEINNLATLSTGGNSFYCMAGCLENMNGIDSVGVFECSPSMTDNALCGLVASTSIGADFSEWVCDDYGYTHTDPCSSVFGAMWDGLSCFGGIVNGIALEEIDLTGTIPPALLLLESLNSIILSGNELSGIYIAYIIVPCVFKLISLSSY